jgi:Ca-activated chloride channel homolog
MSNKNVQLERSTSQKNLPANGAATIYLMLKIIQPKIALDTNRLPLNISFVLDRSGSMQGPKLGYTKQAMQFALRNLDSTDRVSLVTFDNQVELPIPSTTAENKDQLAQLVEAIYTGGSTNQSGGLAATTALKMVLRTNRTKATLSMFKTRTLKSPPLLAVPGQIKLYFLPSAL